MWNVNYLRYWKLRLANWYKLALISPNCLQFCYTSSNGDNYELKYKWCPISCNKILFCWSESGVWNRGVKCHCHPDWNRSNILTNKDTNRAAPSDILQNTYFYWKRVFVALGLLNPVWHRALINLLFSENIRIITDNTNHSNKLYEGSLNQETEWKFDYFVHKIHQFGPNAGKNTPDCCDGVSKAPLTYRV